MPSTYWPDADRIECPFAGSLAVAINDLMWSDTSALLSQGKAYPATSQTDQNSEAANQAYFGPRFLGVAKEARTASQTQSDRGILVDRQYVGPMTIDSGTYYQGDLVAACELANGTQLSNSKVKKTTTAADAIGFILKDSGGAVTTVTVCLISRVLPKYMPTVSATNAAGMTMDDGANIATNTTTGTKIGTSVTQKLSFWNATPVVQPHANAQNAVTATIAAMNATVGSALATNAPVQNTGYGFDAPGLFNTAIAQHNALRVDVLALNTQINAAAVDIAAVNTLVNRLRADLVTVGIIKGVA